MPVPELSDAAALALFRMATESVRATNVRTRALLKETEALLRMVRELEAALIKAR